MHVSHCNTFCLQQSYRFQTLSELPEHFGIANFPEYTITVKTLDIMYMYCLIVFFCFCLSSSHNGVLQETDCQFDCPSPLLLEEGGLVARLIYFKNHSLVM